MSPKGKKTKCEPPAVETAEADFSETENDSKLPPSTEGNAVIVPNADIDVDPSNGSTRSETGEKNEGAVDYKDECFERYFVTKSKVFSSLKELSDAIFKYETESQTHLGIIRSNRTNFRIYQCAQHIDCSFRARFGSRRANQAITLKAYNLQHSGIPRPEKTADGRRWKTRRKGVLDPTVDLAAMGKSGKLVAKDVMKAAASTQGITLTYNEAYRALKSQNTLKQRNEIESFELIIPYLKAFEERNRDSVVSFERSSDNCLLRCFVCPGNTNTKLRHVRPVISLDTTQLSSYWKGTLFVASVKSGLDVVYPVAFAIAADNDTNDGWQYFCSNLKKACPVIHSRNFNTRCNRFRYFTFISNEDSSITDAIQEHFPENNHINCVLGIQQNVATRYGLPASTCIPHIASSFSIRKEDMWLRELRGHSSVAYDYVLSIAPEKWRNTSWIKDYSIPPRYGILSTNLSESTDSMFEKARDCSWLDTIDMILDTMISNIDKLRKEHKDQTGVMPTTKEIMTKRYNLCAGFQVIQIQDTPFEFKVNRSGINYSERAVSHMINIWEKTCTCGKWQDHECPCLDAMAYYRTIQEYTLEDVLDRTVSQFYNYDSQHSLYKENINPVIVEMLQMDGETKPPPTTGNRQPVTSTRKRLRNRSKYADPSLSKVICSACKARGHNARTCEIRQMVKETSEQTNDPNETSEEAAAEVDIDIDSENWL